jgi:hypothetical protein
MNSQYYWGIKQLSPLPNSRASSKLILRTHNREGSLPLRKEWRIEGLIVHAAVGFFLFLRFAIARFVLWYHGVWRR